MNPLSSPLLTDHYQLMMVQSYLEQNMQETAVFEFFVRKLPRGRNFMVAAGLEQAARFSREPEIFIGRTGLACSPFRFLTDRIP